MEMLFVRFWRIGECVVDAMLRLVFSQLFCLVLGLEKVGQFHTAHNRTGIMLNVGQFHTTHKGIMLKVGRRDISQQGQVVL